MKLYQTLFWAGAATAALASCSAEEDYGGTGIPANGQAIEVSTYIPGKRAIDKTTFVEGDKLGLYACRTTGGYANAFTANFMNNVEVTRGASEWTYSPLMAWPTDANEHLSFAAFYPRSTEGTAMTYPFTVNSDFIQQTDLSGGTWSNSLPTDFTIHSGEAEAVTLTSTEQTLAGMLMIPQDVSANRSSFTVTYTHTLAEGGEKTVTRDIFLPNSWAVNQAYNYVITLNLDVNTITVSAETTDFDAPVTPNIGYQAADAVDLGLSVKWASYDYGTVSPYDLGPKYDSDDIADIGTKKMFWGVNWRLPNMTEMRELLDNCTIEAETANGIAGYRITGKNGKSIFIGYDYLWGYESGPGRQILSLKEKKFLGSIPYGALYPIRPVFVE